MNVSITHDMQTKNHQGDMGNGEASKAGQKVGNSTKSCLSCQIISAEFTETRPKQ